MTDGGDVNSQGYKTRLSKRYCLFFILLLRRVIRGPSSFFHLSVEAAGLSENGGMA